MFFRIARIASSILLSGALCAATTSAQAASCRWVGPDNGAWNNPANWSSHLVPTRGDDVVIADGGKVTVPARATVANLSVGAGTQVEGGTLQVTGTTTSSGLLTGTGTLDVPQGATAQFNVDARSALAATGSATGEVTLAPIHNAGRILVKVAKGCTANFASIQNTGSAQVVSDGAVTFGDIKNTGQLDLSVTGALDLGGVANEAGASLSIASNRPASGGGQSDAPAIHFGDLSNAAGGQMKLSGARAGQWFDGQSIHNAGAMQLSGAGLLLAGDVSNAAGATLVLDSDVKLLSSDASAPRLSNAGKIIKPAGSNATLSVEWNNTGQVVVENGTLHIRVPQGKSCDQTGGVTTLEGGVLSVETASGVASGTYELKGGVFDGIGTINGNLRNSGGHIKPGHSPGSITINGNFFQTSNGAIDMEVGGTNPGVTYDQMLINGTAYLGGAMNMVRWGGFCPKDGNSFQLFYYFSRIGRFDRFVDVLPVAGITYDTLFTPSTYELWCYGTAVTPTPAPTVVPTPADTTAPTATLTSPANGVALPSVTTATGTASDAVGVARVTGRLYRYANPATGVAAAFWAGGTNWTSAATASNEILCSGTTNWSFAFPALVPGRYSMRATATDFSNNFAYSATNAFWVDPNAPSVLTISAPLNGSTISTLASVAGTASDASDGSGLTGVRGQIRRSSDGLYWNGSIWAAPLFTFSIPLSGVNWSRTTSLPYGANLVAGTYSFTATATDRAGNAAALTSTFYVAPSATTASLHRTPGGSASSG